MAQDEETLRAAILFVCKGEISRRKAHSARAVSTRSWRVSCSRPAEPPRSPLDCCDQSHSRSLSEPTRDGLFFAPVSMAEANGAPPESSADQRPVAQSPPLSHPAVTSTDPPFPPTSVSDSGLSKRPRDARLIHLILGNLGVTAYQERVPLQLMDFAYRYTSSTLQDALHLTAEQYGTAGPIGGRIAASHDLSAITLQSIRLSIESRNHYQFNPGLPKEYLQELAQEKNRIALPPVSRDVGLRLPPERYCLTGVGFGLKNEWEVDGDETGENVDFPMGGGERNGVGNKEGGDRGDDDDARMEDIFGDDAEANEDKPMEVG
jgi:transcription initiation factor TFIID subunit 9B